MMHDWVLISVDVDWEKGTALMRVRDPASSIREIHAEDLRELSIQRLQPWGPSESINAARGPMQAADATLLLEVEMQSGDLLTLRARLIKMPD